ncbi:hypothetical protein SHL15_8304 [Streptomyces hygroscopicus subsp. limoneus]|nr:hypothetical protein SHL15_8304 [Streptomyces hygroscopicus subsp. limoneus]
MTTEKLWLVGLEFHTELGRPVRHYYVIPHIADAELARVAALRKAETPREREGRGGRDLDASPVELRLVTVDPLGVPRLSTTAQSPARSREPGGSVGDIQADEGVRTFPVQDFIDPPPHSA